MAKSSKSVKALAKLETKLEKLLKETGDYKDEVVEDCSSLIEIEGKEVDYNDLFLPYDKNDKTDFGLEHAVRGTGGGIKFDDKVALAKQKGVLKDLLKKIGKNLFSGVSIINISLPVRIFEPRSFLQRISDTWCFAPLFLNKAAETKGALERFKLVMTFCLAGLHQGSKQLKPFNPILGETHQAIYPDGTKMYLEQISHHPPVTAFQLVGKGWTYYGAHEYQASFKAPNGIMGAQTGSNTVAFDDGTTITYDMPKVIITGAMMGERNFSWVPEMKFYDEKNQLECEVKFNPDKLTGVGSWFKSAKSPSDTIKGTVTLGGQEITKLLGSWLDGFKFGNKQYWTKKSLLPQHCKPVENPLPSDSTLRCDVLALAKADEELAEKHKHLLEQRQRADRCLREIYELKREG